MGIKPAAITTAIGTMVVAGTLLLSPLVWSQTSPLPSPQGVPNPTVTPNGAFGPAGNQPLAGPNTPLLPSQPTNAPRILQGFAPGAGPTSGVAQGAGPGQSFGAPLSSATGNPMQSMQGVGRGLPGMPGGPPLDEPMGAGAVPCPYC